MKTLASISTIIRTLRWGTPIYIVFGIFWLLYFTTSFALWAPGIGSSCTQKLLERQTLTTYDPWPVSQLLAINLGFGIMPFSTAKIIDVLWDVVVGRGGQVLLTYVAYRVFTKSLGRAMEGSQVSYHTFAAFAFEPGTVTGVFMLARDFASNRSLRSKMIVSWALVSTLYIVAFPTLSSAMTGYTSVMEAYLEDKSQNLVRWELFREVVYSIEDADRIDPYFKRDTLVFASVDDDLSRATYNYIRNYNILDNPERNISSAIQISSHSYSLGPPVLNITEVYFYTYKNETSIHYDRPWIASHLSCQPTGSTYQWGFSFLLTFIFFVLTVVWSIGMFAMWMDAHVNSRVDRSGREMGGMFRSVIDLATAIRGDLGEAANQCSNSKLEKRLRRSKGGMNIPSDELPLSRMGESGKWCKMKRRRWMAQAQQDECLTTNS